MEDFILSLLIVVALLFLLKTIAPLGIPILIKLFPKQVEQTKQALLSKGSDQIVAFEDFSPASQKALRAWRKELQSKGFQLLVEYKSSLLEQLGGESASSVWHDPERKLLVCLSSVVNSRFFQLLDLLKGFRNLHLGTRENAILLESTRPGVGRLFTYCGSSPLPEMPIRYKVKSLPAQSSMEHIFEVHNKRLAKWLEQSNAPLLSPLLSYDSKEIFFEEQLNIRQELRRFTDDATRRLSPED